MDLPSRLESLLRNGGLSLQGAVFKSVGDFETWLKNNDLVFFSEYTPHGVEHVESVLRGVVWLLPEETWEILGPEDAAVLVLAVLLHDCAMHLSRDGFLRLIQRESNWPPSSSRFLKSMNDRPWPKLWERFLREASRWDEQRRVALFGKPRSVRRPPDDDTLWDDVDKQLIGEFLRRHHARLAHEIAICGVPGPSDDRLEITGLEPWLADLAGLVARSHGVDLRSVVDLLPRGNRRNMRGVHAPLLMSLVRIADYLEIEASRAPRLLLKVRTLRSPVSRLEWEKHHTVPYTKIDEEDPEAIWIDAEPENLEAFVSLQDLFAGIQRELDDSWAVLGEVYKEDSRFGLRIRRVRSTLDDLDAFSARAPFVPVKAAFESAGGDLLKLMVGPMYNHEPAYGIRELMQNAVDACRELADLLDHSPGLKLDRQELDADVVVTVHQEEEGQGWIIVDDRGIGMSPEVIVNYFLKAGASLRASEAWYQRHVHPDGRPRVARSGRFGLGVLATFLLGEEVEVTTRQADEPAERGIRFVARLDRPHIELRWFERPIGTTIRVRVTQPVVFDALADVEAWDWYRLQKPSVLRRVLLQRESRENRLAIPTGEMVTLEHGEIIPHGEDPLPVPWRRLRSPNFGEILWSLQRESGWADISNGIVLKRPEVLSAGWRVLWPRSGPVVDFFLFRPRLAVMEGASLLPVDLRRTEIVSPIPFGDDLIITLCRDILASLLVRAAESRADLLRQIAGVPSIRDPDSFISLKSLWHPAISTNRNEHGTKLPFVEREPSWLFVTEKGLTLEDPALQTEETRRGVSYIVISPESKSELNQLDDAVLTRALQRIPPGFPLGAQSALGFRDDLNEHCRSGGYNSAVIVLPTRRWGAEKHKSGYRGLNVLDVDKGWTVVWTGDDPMNRLDLNRLCSEAALAQDLPLVFFLLPEGPVSQEPRNPLSRLWQELIYHPEIHYERTLRAQVMARAFHELQEEIDLWQKLATAEIEHRQTAARYWIDTRRFGPVF